MKSCLARPWSDRRPALRATGASARSSLCPRLLKHWEESFGLEIADLDNPVELFHVVRSHDDAVRLLMPSPEAADTSLMADQTSQPPGRPWWSNVWIRAGLLHPLLLVGPCVGLCLLLARRTGSEIGDVAWGFWAIPIAALVSFLATAVMAARRPLETNERVAVVLLGLCASGAAFILGFIGWFHAADVACHGQYECPL